MRRAPTWALCAALVGCAADPTPAPAPPPRPSPAGETRDPFAGMSGLISRSEWLERRASLSGVTVYTNEIDEFGPPRSAGPMLLVPRGWIHDPALCARLASAVVEWQEPFVSPPIAARRYLGLEFSDGREPSAFGLKLLCDEEGRPVAVRFDDTSAAVTDDFGRALGEGYGVEGGLRIVPPAGE